MPYSETARCASFQIQVKDVETYAGSKLTRDRTWKAVSRCSVVTDMIMKSSVCKLKVSVHKLPELPQDVKYAD
jgi:hypothetical protein